MVHDVSRGVPVRDPLAEIEVEVGPAKIATRLLAQWVDETGGLDKPPSYHSDPAGLICALYLADIADSLHAIKEALA